MKRVAVLLSVLIGVGGVSYGVGVARQEAVYQSYIEEGDAALSRDDNAAAVEAFTVAISLKEDSMAAHLKRGEAYRRRHELEAALRDLRRAVELDPFAPHAREILGDVHYATAHYSTALDQYREGLKLDDRSARVLYKQALTLVKLGQIVPAAGSLRLALGINDQFAEAHYLLGVCLGELHRPAEAIAALERSVALNPALLEAREQLAETYGRLERFAERNRQLEALAALDPGAAREVAIALGYARDGQVERAVLRLGNATRHFPDHTEPYIALGRLWLERAERGGGRVELSKAIGAFEGAVGNSSSSEAHTFYGRALMLSGDLPRAEASLEQAIVRFPVDPLAFYYLADVADRRGHTAIAQKALIDYAALEGLDSPRFDAPLLARLADAYFRADDLSAARQTLSRAMQKDADDPKVRALRLRLDAR
jgi:tetratricopeptide (TPR) repeat protein